MKEFSGLGMSVQRKPAQIITEEELMWAKGILGKDNPAQLADTVLYLIGLHFALHARKEHRNQRFFSS